MKQPVDLIINLIVLAIIPAFAEELLFRGCIQQVLKEWSKNAHVAIWGTAILFSFVHFEFYGFLPRMLLGALLGYLFYWSGNLWVPIIAHLVQNGGQVVLAYMHDHGLTSIDITSDEPLPVSWKIISLVGTIALIYFFRRASDNRKFIY
jgi:membrane protease YdiL (CAAX protease family)